MTNADLFRQQAWLLVTIGVLHALGLFLFLQWQFWWYDIMLHFMGGVWVALAALWFYMKEGWVARMTTTVLIALSIGLGWELFEYLVGSARESNYFYDTSLDILMDTLGAIAGFLYVYYRRVDEKEVLE